MELRKPNAKKLNHLNSDSKGVSVKKALKLIENSPFKDEIIELLKVKDHENQFIEIPGSDLLVDLIIKREEEFKKFDLVANKSDIKILDFDKDNNASMLIESDESHSNINAKTISQSVKTELLDDFYKINRFAEFCRLNNFDYILKQSINSLEEEKLEGEKKLRMITEEGNFLLRGLVSPSYKDYNIPLSVFITLLILHKRSLNKDESYFVESYFVSHSDLNVVFSKRGFTEIGKNVNVSFGIELSNNEVGKKAFLLKGVYNFYSKDKNFVAKPKESKNLLLFSLHHNNKNISEQVLKINENIHVSEELFLKRANEISKIKNFTQILDFIKRTISKSRSLEKEQTKENITANLKGKVNTLFDFLERLDLIESIIQKEEIQSLNYWREIVYEGLFKKGK